MNYYVIHKQENYRKQKILSSFGFVPEKSGIYILLRTENGVNYSYIGQAKNLLKRLSEHLKGYPQIIDKSIYKRKLYSATNLIGWKLEKYIVCDITQLDELEKSYIDKYLQLGYQSYNRTLGSQSVGKTGMFENKDKGYLQGLHNGYLKTQKEIAHLFELHLDYSIKGKPTKTKLKALEKFKEFIEKV